MIPVEQWDKDHWSLLLYVESRAVNYGGKPDPRHMRCNQDTHPAMAVIVTGPFQHPTRVKQGPRDEGHDDWDCFDDLEAAGLVTNEGTGLHHVWVLTSQGWDWAHQLRQHRATGQQVRDFRPKSHLYFSYDPEDTFSFHETEEEARATAQKTMEAHRGYAAEEGWCDFIAGLCWGEVKERAVCARQVSACEFYECEEPEADHNHEFDLIEEYELETSDRQHPS